MKQKVYCIYYLENKINGKMYIGKTGDFEQRVKDHIKDSKKDNPKLVIHRAIKKYGIDNFNKEIFSIFDTELEALQAEKYWINYLKDNDVILYNIVEGGRGLAGFKHSEETKKHWSITRKGKMAGPNHPLYGKPRPEEVKIKSRNKQLGRVIPQEIIDKVAKSNTGKKRSPEIKQKMSNQRKGEGNPNSKLTWEKVKEIRILLDEGKMLHKEIAKIYGIATNIISRIKNNKIWKI